MKIKGIEVEQPKELKTIIYQCPYCSKKFISKNSYYTHISKDYCWGFDMRFTKIKNLYEENKITIQQYYEWCYENGCLEYLNLDEEIISKLGNDFYNKISSMYSKEDY